MRVAVVYPAHTQIDPDTGEKREVPESIVAYRHGRIEDRVDDDGTLVTKAERAKKLLAAAKAEHPDKEVRVEYLVHNGDGEGEGEEPDNAFEAGTSRWVQGHEVPDGAISPKAGRVVVHELEAEVHAEGVEG